MPLDRSLSHTKVGGNFLVQLALKNVAEAGGFPKGQLLKSGSEIPLTGVTPSLQRVAIQGAIYGREEFFRGCRL